MSDKEESSSELVGQITGIIRQKLADLSEMLKAKDEELKAKDEELKAKDEGLKEKVEQLKANNEQLKVKDEQLEAKDHKLEAKDNEFKASYNKLKTEAAELKLKASELNSKAKQATSLMKQLSKAQAENSHLRDKASNLSTELKAKDEELKAMDKELRAMDTKLTLTVEEANSFFKQLKLEKAANSHLQKVLGEQRAKVYDLSAKLNTVNTELNEKAVKVDSLGSVQANIHRLREELEKQEARAEDLLKVKDEVIITEFEIKMEPEPLEQEVAAGGDERSSRKRHHILDLGELDENERNKAKSSRQTPEGRESDTAHQRCRTPSAAPIAGASLVSGTLFSEDISVKDPAGSRSSSVTRSVSYKPQKSRDSSRVRASSDSIGGLRPEDAQPHIFLPPPGPWHLHDILRFTEAGMTAEAWAEAETRDLERRGHRGPRSEVRQHLERKLVAKAASFMPFWWKNRLEVPSAICLKCGDASHRTRECWIAFEKTPDELCAYCGDLATQFPHSVAFCKELHTYCLKCFRYGHGFKKTCPRDPQADRERWHRYKAQGYYTENKYFEYEPSQREIARQVDFIFGSFAQTFADAGLGFSHAPYLWSMEQLRSSSPQYNPPPLPRGSSQHRSASSASTTSAGERELALVNTGAVPENEASNGLRRVGRSRPAGALFTLATTDIIGQMGADGGHHKVREVVLRGGERRLEGRESAEDFTPEVK